MRHAFALLLTLMSLAFAAACGDSDDSGSGGSGSGDATSTEPNEIASKSPQQQLAETAAALRDVKSFHVDAKEREGTLSGDVAVPRKLRLNLKQGPAAADMVLLEDTAYMKGNTAFWKDSDAADVAERLSGRWLKVPGSVGGLSELTKQIDPANLSRCLVKDHGTLTSGGESLVGGKPAIVIVDRGDKPGTAPGRLYVAATGEPLPLRTLATGPERPGGKKDPLCDSDTPTRKGDEVLFSKYDEPVDIKAPPDALDLGELSGGGTQS